VYIKYGSFSLLGYEASLSVRVEAVRSSLGFNTTRMVRFDIDGELVNTDQYAVTTRLSAIQSAFNIDYQDIGLYHDNNSPTVHVLANGGDNLTGNKVLYAEYPQTKDGEYVTGRKFKIGIGAEIYASETNILEYKDTITYKGNGGPVWKWIDNPWWGYYPVMVAPRSLQTITHEGYVVGMLGYELPPTPFFSPPFEDNVKRVVQFIGPDRYPRANIGYRTNWVYTYTLYNFDDFIRPTHL